jgi:dTDP-glucose pyrophosphorylase
MIKEYSNLIVNKDDSILNILKKMDDNNRKLLIVLDENTFISVISIGDIQRAIINNIDLNSSIKNILRKDVRFAFEDDDLSIVKIHMRKHRNEFMPIISHLGKLVKIIFWEDLFNDKRIEICEKLRLPVIIMAGGRGSRLKPLTNILPKPLIPIRDKTIIEEIMDKFLECGCNDFFLSVNYKADIIRHYFSTLESNLYRVSYFQEDKPLGTAGSLHLLKGKINTTFFVTNCDIIIEQDYTDIYKYHKENNNEITVVAAIKQYPIPYGTITTKENGLLDSIIEKPEIIYKINTGFYILEPHLLDEIPINTFYHITTLIDKLQKENRNIGVFPISQGSWLDMGDWDNYLRNVINK